MTRLRTVLLLPLAMLGACSGEDVGSAPSARLISMADCNAVKDYMKEVQVQRMNRLIDDELASYMRGERCYHSYGEEDGAGSPSPGTTGTGTGGGSGSGSGPTTSTGTNNQVAGVDEADFVKNDGQYIYLAQNGVFRIVDSWPADLTHEVSVTPIEGTPKKLFVVGDKALVYVAVGNANQSYWNRECTYGYTCDFTGDGTSTKLLVFDLTDRTAPVLEREVTLSGSLIAGRRIGSAVHTVVTQAANPFPALELQPDVNLCGYAGTRPTAYHVMLAKQAYDRLRSINQANIMATDLDQKLPTISDSAGLTPEGAAATCESLYKSSINDGAAFTSIVSVDIDHPGPVKMSTIVSAPGAVYASEDSLYMAVPHQYSQGNWGGYETTDSISTVHKFRISDVAGMTKYLASGLVNGRVLNQFSMDEKDHLLRIATTDGHVPNPDTNSYLTVLEEQHDDLVAIGKIGGIAPDEDIRSVRFDGDRAFIVTFKKTDPLFAFDLSNPSDPEEVGELQIPGFSTYMHLMDSTHLLTIGYDADDHGSFAFFDGIQLQIFDVSNMASPQLTSRYLIGTRGSSSEALTNHLAFTWYPEYGLLSLPMTICEGGGDGTYGQTMTFSGLMVFDTSVANGFAEHGRVPHTTPSDVTCYNWWANAESAVKRSLFLDNYVYSISDAELKVRDVNAMSTELVTLALAPQP